MFEKRFFIYQNYHCAIRANGLGFLCGYVFIPKTHQSYNLTFVNEGELSVHGGITYEDDHLPGGYEFKLPLGKWIGFDCAHNGDGQDPDYLTIKPTMRCNILGSLGGIFKDPSYVEQEIINMINQLGPILHIESDEHDFKLELPL